MSRTSTLRRAMALPVIASCSECHWHRDCGGYRDEPSLFGDSCFARHCCGGREDCNYLCPSNPRFATMMNEVEGLVFDRLPELTQRQTELPRYAPAILNHSRRAKPLNIPFAAVPVEEVFRAAGSHLEAVARTPEGLRDHLRLGHNTRIILNCVRPDAKIERLWEFWVQDDLPAQLAPLGIEMVIGPNFSHLRGVPRLESVGNRMRHLICVRDFQRAGLLAVPHLSVVDPPDWDWWRGYLLGNRQVRYVAFEFETGYKDAVEGTDAILQLAEMQRIIGRGIHLIVVGGTQFRQQIRWHFRECTFINASPFWNTISRQRGRLSTGKVVWGQSPTLPGELLDELLAHNLRIYTEWFGRQIDGAASVEAGS